MEALNRSFIGVRIPLEVTGLIDQAMMSVKRKPGVTDVRWNSPSELLINVCSLGELSPMTLGRLPSVIGPICASYPRMRLTLEGLTGVPNLIQPRYVVAQIQGDVEWLCRLAPQLDAAVMPYVPHRDVKPFQPQIILGRLKTESEPNRVALGRALRIIEAPKMGELMVDAMELLISSASTSGIGYSVVERLPLSG